MYFVSIAHARLSTRCCHVMSTVYNICSSFELLYNLILGWLGWHVLSVSLVTKGSIVSLEMRDELRCEWYVTAVIGTVVACSRDDVTG